MVDCIIACMIFWRVTSNGASRWSIGLLAELCGFKLDRLPCPFHVQKLCGSRFEVNATFLEPCTFQHYHVVLRCLLAGLMLCKHYKFVAVSLSPLKTYSCAVRCRNPAAHTSINQWVPNHFEIHMLVASLTGTAPSTYNVFVSLTNGSCGYSEDVWTDTRLDKSALCLGTTMPTRM